jgi:hypothetical protein
MATTPITRAPQPQRLRLTLADGAQTTAHVVEHPLADTVLEVVRLPGLTPLEAWCTQERVDHALVGGFYVRTPGSVDGPDVTGQPLGELRIAGERLVTVPFQEPWSARRACIHVSGGTVRIARRDALPAAPDGALLQAGPLLVRDGLPVSGDDEGFSSGAGQFDSDITRGRYPRAALGCDGQRLIALVCDGRDDDEAGLTMAELAQAMADLGVREALNLDGGGSASLVCHGRLCNVPRESHATAIPGGRAIATALTFLPR